MMKRNRYYHMSLLFFLFKAKANKSGRAPIYLRITMTQHTRAQLSTRIFVAEKDWNASAQRIGRTEPLHAIYNAELNHLRTDAEEFFYLLKRRDRFISPQLLKKMVQGDKYEKSICQVAEEFIQFKKGQVSDGTATTLVVRYNNLRKFLADTNRGNLYCDQADVFFLNHYADYLKLKGFGNTHIRKLIGFIKQVVKYAHLHGLIDSNRVSSFQVKAEPPKKLIFLDETELSRLEQYRFASERLQQVADCFVFQCYTGVAYVDLANFSTDYIERNVHGHEWIRYERIKVNGGWASLPLLPEAKAILEKYAYQLPVITNQKYNAYLKEVADVVGIPKHITTHVGRKTFGMILLNQDVPIETVSRMLGHKSIRMTEKLYAQVLDRKIARDMQRFIQPEPEQEGVKMRLLR